MMQRTRFMTVLLVLALLTSFLPAASVRADTGTTPFQDVNNLPQQAQITALWRLGVVTGFTSDQFNPSGGVTRAQMATMIIRAMGKAQDAEQLKGVASEFRDVPAGHWASGAVTLANRMNIIKGDGTNFMPNSPVNYAQAATMLVRALGYEGQVTGGYPTGYVVKANELGLLKDSQFELFANVNRAEAAVLLYNAVYRAPAATTKLTWSQTVFKRVQTVSLDPLPQYAAPDQKLTVKATARDLMDNPIPDAAITLRVTTGAGSIAGNILTVGEEGPIIVEAAVGDITASQTVIPVQDLAITPASFQANKGGKIQLEATAKSGSQSVSVQPAWKVLSGPATVDEHGLVTVTDYGTVTVQAALGGLTALSTGQAVGNVSIGEKPDYIVPGERYTLKATATDSTGHPINVPITWSATGIVIDRTAGVVTAVRGAEAVVTATAAGITDQVTIPVIQKLEITGAPEAVLIGQRVNLLAVAVDGDGNRYPVQPQWERNNSSVGVVGVDGSFVGVASGSITVTATLGSIREQATFRVSGPPTRISVSAPVTSLPAGIGASTTVTVKLLDSAGSLSPVDDQPIAFTLNDTSHGVINRTLALTQQGQATLTYTAGTEAGVGTITATAPGTKLLQQSISISNYAQVPHHIELTATPNPLATGGAVSTLTATLKDSNNQMAVTSQSVYVNLAASGVGGSLLGTSITIPAGQASGTITFISNNQEGTTRITGSSTYTVNPLVLNTAKAGPAAGVKIRPITGTTPVTGLTSLLVTVDVVDEAGVVLSSDSSTRVQLTVTPPEGSTGQPASYTATASGGKAAFQVPAANVGTVTLTAGLADGDGDTDTTTAQFIPGVAYSLRLTSQPDSLIADGISTGQVVAEVVDGNGNVMTNVNTTVTFRKLVDDGATAEISSLVVPTLSGRAVLTIRSNRIAGSDIWFASAPGLETQNLATVATANGTGDSYTIRLAGSSSFSVGGGGTLVIQVVDDRGRVVTGDSGRTITATTTMPGVTVTPAATTQNGAATFAVLGNQATTGTIDFTSSGLSVPTISVPVTIGNAGSAYSLYASSSSSSARVGNTITLWVRVMDNQGNTLSSDNGRSITASVNSSRASLGSSRSTTVNGMASFTLNCNSAGTVTVTFTASGLQQPQATLSLTINN